MLISTPVHALYSPTISNRVDQIREHVRVAQEQNGLGSLMEVSQTIVSQYEAKRELGQPSGIPGLAKEAQKKIIQQAVLQSVKEPLDGLFMAFNILPSQGGGVISNCLRNDLWALESLKDVVGEEMVKAYLLSNVLSGDQLSADYDYLVYQIGLLKRFGKDPDAPIAITIEEEGKEKQVEMSMRQYLFGSEDSVYYYALSFPSEQGCPEGEFEQALVKVKNSAKTLATLGGGQGQNWNWGSLWEMAEIRAKQRASQWFAANQIALTLGGGQGGRQNSLFRNNGWDQRVAEAKTQIRILKNLLGPIAAPFSLDLYENIDGVAYVGGEHSCVYYEPTSEKYYPCTDAQAEAFQFCKLSLKEAKDEGKVDKDAGAWRQTRQLKALKEASGCHRFADPNAQGATLDYWAQVEAEEKEGELRLENELRAFRYHLQLEDVGEESLESFAGALVSLDHQIKRGIESSGSPEADPGLPAFQDYMQTMMNRHCPN